MQLVYFLLCSKKEWNDLQQDGPFWYISEIENS